MSDQTYKNVRRTETGSGYTAECSICNGAGGACPYCTNGRRFMSNYPCPHNGETWIGTESAGAYVPCQCRRTADPLASLAELNKMLFHMAGRLASDNSEVRYSGTRAIRELERLIGETVAAYHAVTENGGDPLFAATLKETGIVCESCGEPLEVGTAVYTNGFGYFISDVCQDKETAAELLAAKLRAERAADLERRAASPENLAEWSNQVNELSAVIGRRDETIRDLMDTRDEIRAERDELDGRITDLARTNGQYYRALLAILQYAGGNSGHLDAEVRSYAFRVAATALGIPAIFDELRAEIVGPLSHRELDEINPEAARAELAGAENARAEFDALGGREHGAWCGENCECNAPVEPPDELESLAELDEPEPAGSGEPFVFGARGPETEPKLYVAATRADLDDPAKRTELSGRFIMSDNLETIDTPAAPKGMKPAHMNRTVAEVLKYGRGKNGWSLPTAGNVHAAKWHYYVDARSLCGKYADAGPFAESKSGRELTPSRDRQCSICRDRKSAQSAGKDGK